MQWAKWALLCALCALGGASAPVGPSCVGPRDPTVAGAVRFMHGYTDSVYAKMWVLRACGREGGSTVRSCCPASKRRDAGVDI
jgi:hypothetical protein